MNYGSGSLRIVAKMSSSMAQMMNARNIVFDFDNTLSMYHMIIKHNFFEGDRFSRDKIESFIMDDSTRLITDPVLFEVEKMGLNLHEMWCKTHIQNTLLSDSELVLATHISEKRITSFYELFGVARAAGLA